MLKKLHQVLFIIIILGIILSSCSSDSSPISSENDATNPTVSFRNIANGSNVSGVFNVEVEASDNNAIDKVQLYLDDNLIDTQYNSQSQFSIDSELYSNGNYTLKAKAWDEAENTSSISISIKIENQENDITDPTVSFGNIANGSNVSGVFNVEVEASDNNAIDKVQLYLDDNLINTQYNSQSQFTVNCNDFSDGTHILKAKAWDEAGNYASVSINVTTKYDFAPYSDGKIEIAITHYKELDPVDLYGYGDPYFIYILKINGVEYDRYTSQVWEDKNELNINISHKFNIPDDTREYQFIVYVMDDDGGDDDQLDYTDGSGKAYVWTMKTISSYDFTEVYNGEDDGSSNFDDNDCKITLNVKMIN